MSEVEGVGVLALGGFGLGGIDGVEVGGVGVLEGVPEVKDCERRLLLGRPRLSLGEGSPNLGLWDSLCFTARRSELWESGEGGHMTCGQDGTPSQWTIFAVTI